MWAGSRTGPFPYAIYRPSRNSTADSPPNVPGIYEEDIGRKQIPQKCGKEAPRAVHHRAHRKRAAGMFLIRGGASFPTIPGWDGRKQKASPDFSHKKTGPSFHWNPSVFLWSGWRDLNARPQRPERCALAKLSHIPLQERTLHRRATACKLFFQKNFSSRIPSPPRPCPSIPGQAGKRFVHIRQLGFDFMKKGAKTHIPVRLPGKNFFEVALCRTQVPRTILATARS